MMADGETSKYKHVSSHSLRIAVWRWVEQNQRDKSET